MIQMITTSLSVMMMMVIPVMNVFLGQKSLQIMTAGTMMVTAFVMMVMTMMIMTVH